MNSREEYRKGIAKALHDYVEKIKSVNDEIDEERRKRGLPSLEDSIDLALRCLIQSLN